MSFVVTKGIEAPIDKVEVAGSFEGNGQRVSEKPAENSSVSDDENHFSRMSSGKVL